MSFHRKLGLWLLLAVCVSALTALVCIRGGELLAAPKGPKTPKALNSELTELVGEIVKTFSEAFPDQSKTFAAIGAALTAPSPLSPAPGPFATDAAKIRDEISSLRVEREQLQAIVTDQKRALTLALREFVRTQQEAHKWDWIWGFLGGVVSSLVANWIWIKTRKNGERELA